MSALEPDQASVPALKAIFFFQHISRASFGRACSADYGLDAIAKGRLIGRMSEVPEGIPGSQICWNKGKSCAGSVFIHGGGNFRFLIDDGQSLDGCPQMGAMLRVPRPFESFDRFEIISFGLRTLGSPPNAWSFCAKKLPPEQP
jgi:hypothetical protein